MPVEKRTVGDRVRQLHNDQKLTQAAFGAKIGKPQGRISDWISGKVVPSRDDLFLLADKFGASVDFLMGLSDRMYRTDVRPTSELHDWLAAEIDRRVKAALPSGNRGFAPWLFDLLPAVDGREVLDQVTADQLRIREGWAHHLSRLLSTTRVKGAILSLHATERREEAIRLSKNMLRSQVEAHRPKKKRASS